jgi:parallel beta-helix repeat protein
MRLILNRKTPRAVSPAFQIESLEDRLVPSHALTVGAGYQYPTITAALAAAPANATIDVYPGTYNEAVVVTKNGIQLNAEGPGVIVQPTAVPPVTLGGTNVGGAAIDVYANNVVVNGFTVNGAQDTDGNLWVGVRVIEGGSATIKNNTVEGITAATVADDANVSIQVGDSLVAGPKGGGSALVENNTVTGYAGVGVLVDGAYSVAGVTGNTITGLGTANGGVSEYGVQVSDGANAFVQGNTISNNTISGFVAGGYNPSPVSAGIFFYNDGGASSVAVQNTVTGNDDGILVQQSNGSFWGTVQVVANTVKQNFGYGGIVVEASNAVVVAGNTVTGNSTWNGIALNNSSNVQVDANTVGNNPNADGIYDFEGTNDQFAWNNSYCNGNNGFNLQSTTGDVLAFNTASKNAFNGVLLNGTTGSVVIENVITSNGESGVQLEGAQKSVILLNVFFGNQGGSVSSDSATTGTVQSFNGFCPSLKFGSSWACGFGNMMSFVYCAAESDLQGFCH